MSAVPAPNNLELYNDKDNKNLNELHKQYRYNSNILQPIELLGFHCIGEFLLNTEKPLDQFQKRCICDK